MQIRGQKLKISLKKLNSSHQSVCFITAVVEEGGRRIAHRHGCSGIDGITVGKMPGTQTDKLSLFVAYGIYSDTTRSDNDHQVILRYDTAQWRAFE